MDGIHDLGGLQGFGRVQHTANSLSYKPVFHEDWEKLGYSLLFLGAAELGLFNGKVDGFYGPMTASAIRSFETRNGMTPTGANDATVVEAILGADANGRMSAIISRV